MSSDGASARLEVDYFKRCNSKRFRPMELSYVYRWPGAAADLAN